MIQKSFLCKNKHHIVISIFLLGHLHFFFTLMENLFKKHPIFLPMNAKSKSSFKKKVLVCMHRPSKKEIMPDVYTAKSVARD